MSSRSFTVTGIRWSGNRGFASKIRNPPTIASPSTRAICLKVKVCFVISRLTAEVGPVEAGYGEITATGKPWASSTGG